VIFYQNGDYTCLKASFYHYFDKFLTKDLPSTRVYLQLEASLFATTSDEWLCKVAKTPDEAVELVERGFEFVNQIGVVYLYR
jgi:hypothetical protein